MGVPKFYRWLSERFPCLSEVVKEHQIPEFDNLYLDMNGIIHNCSHPNDDDPHFRITEEKIFQDIFHYIEVLFRMIQPKKVFFMAIDGVAPRAKMNQQRGRRFRSAKEAELNEKKARDRGEVLPKEARFDSNCITPGTPFMCRLHEQLKYFISSKMSTDSLWQGVRVILSGHETPGEGEHKIMDFIRFEKSQPGYDPNIRHCLYGLDADLIMLGMCTHDPHFSLLREEVRFGGKKQAQKRIVTPEETTFHLLHLSLLREYLDHEFGELRSKLLSFEYDIEKVIDDWIMLGFLVGNDFIPNLPHLHINKGALTELYLTYKRVLPTLGGYINNDGILNLGRFEKFMSALAENEMDRFDDIYSDSKWLEGKTAAKGGKKHVVKPTPGPAHVDQMLMGDDNLFDALVPIDDGGAQCDPELQRLLQSTDDLMVDDPVDVEDKEDDPFGSKEDSGRGDVYHMEFRQHKREYYISKMKYQKVTADVLREQAEGYVRAIQWNLHYYYNGCASWSWYYQHHFAPYITDIKDFAKMEMKFELSKPFLPYEQLLSVLPAASKELLPPALQGLMDEQLSPILDYYPHEFECDLNGKQQEWEAVVLIPFIDEKRLLEAVTPRYSYLSTEEKNRNSHGPMCSYTYSRESIGRYLAPLYFPPIEMNHALLAEVWRSDWDVPIQKLQKGLMKGVKLDVFFPGFPTLKHIPHTVKFKAESVKVFEQTSRGTNAMLVLNDQGRPDINEVADQLLGQEIWVSWPHMIEAKVVAVSNSQTKFSLKKGPESDFVSQDDSSNQEFRLQSKSVADRYKQRWGVVVGDTHIIVHACTMTGRKYICGQKGKITLEKQWSKASQPFALQTTRKDILVHDPSFTQYRTLPELFPNGSTCFMLGNTSQYGCQGSVVQISPEHRGRIQLNFIEPKDVDLTAVISQQKSLTPAYYPGYKAAQRLGITSHLLSRITGSIFILKGAKEAEAEAAGRINVGLNLKFNKRNEEVCGFTKKGEESGWMYSTKTILTISQYIQRYPGLFEYLGGGNNVQNDIFHHLDVFPDGNGEEILKEMTEWLKALPCMNAERQPCGTQALDVEIVKVIEEAVAEQKSDRKKQLTMQVRPHLLFKPNLSQGATLPDPETTFRLFDRVVNVREGFSVPLGLRGTVIGIHAGHKQEDVVVEVLFDSEFSGGLTIRSSPNRCYRTPGSALINLSHGQRVLNKSKPTPQPQQKPTAVVKPLGDNVQPIPNFWDQRKQQQQQNKQNKKGAQHSRYNIPVYTGSKEASPLATAAQKIGVPATHSVQPPDPKNLPLPNFSVPKKKGSPQNESKEHFEQIWNNIKPPPKKEPEGEDMSDFLAALQMGSKPKKQQQATPSKATSKEIAPNVQTFFDKVAESSPKTAKKEPVKKPVATSFVPLQVSMRTAKQHRDAQQAAAPAPTPADEEKPATNNPVDNRVEQWVERTAQQNRQKKQPNPPQKEVSVDGGESNKPKAKKGNKKRLAANFGPK